MPKTKKNIKVRDLKPTKDAKGGGNPPKGVSGALTGAETPGSKETPGFKQR